MSKGTWFLAWVAAVSAPLFGQGSIPVNLSGTVTDIAGAPVAAVAVRLEVGGLTATTGADGRFTLTGGTGIRDASQRVPFAAIHRGSLFLSLPDRSSVTYTAYGLEGRALFTLERHLEAGSHSLSLPKMGSGVRFFKVKAGSREMVVRSFTLEGALRGSGLGVGVTAVTSGGKAALAKQAAVPYYDAISASKTGFLKSYVSITNSDSSNISIKLLASASPKFSFFVSSLKAMRDFSKSQNGFGGDLRFGETGQGAGLRGADKLCAAIAERSMANSSFKGWRAFLSVSVDSYGKQADAIGRIGNGPWHDRLGRMVAPTLNDLKGARPANGDAIIANDLPNEDGVPNHKPDPTQPAVDNHHVLTGSTTGGVLYGATATCQSWTTSATNAGRPRIGFSWPAGNRLNWMSGQDEGGCGAGVNLAETGGSDPSNPIVGSGGGYGGIYCFALNP